MPRALAAALVLLAVVAIVVLVVVVVVAGITGQSAEISAQAAGGVDRLQGWLKSLGVDSSSASGADLDREDGDAGDDLDARARRRPRDPRARLGPLRAVVRRARDVLPAQGRARDAPAGSTATSGCPSRSRARSRGSVITSLRGYFRGVTIVAAFNGVVVGLARARPRRPARGDDRRRHLRHGVHPVHRRDRRRRVRRPARARRAGHRRRGGDARRRHPRQRPAAEPRPAVRDGLRAPPQPARRPRRDDRRGLPVRDARARARGPARLRRRADREGAEPAARARSAAPPPAATEDRLIRTG